MMLTIYGLPPRTTFQTLKTLIKQECNIIDFIVDNLVDDGANSKKVRIGVSDDTEGYRIMKSLDGFRMSSTHLLKIVPVGKPINQYDQKDQRSSFQNQGRSDYSNQSQLDFPNQPKNDFGNRGHMNTRNFGPSDQQPGNFRNSGPSSNLRPHSTDQRQHGHMDMIHPPSHADARNSGTQDSYEPMGRQWGSNVNQSSNQWIPVPQAQSQTQGYQRSQGSFGQQQTQRAPDSYGTAKGPQEQRYGFQSKPNVPNQGPNIQSHNLRSIEIVDIPRQPQYQEKPITIMKDNFQGPSQYNMSGQPEQGHFQGHGPPPVWNQQSQPSKQPFDDSCLLRTDKRGNFPSQANRQLSPDRSQRNMPLDRDMALNREKNYPNAGRRMSPSGRPFPTSDRHSPIGRHGIPVREYSPSGRRFSPGKRNSPTRKFSPTSRKFSPPSRKFSPPGRKFTTTGRKHSPPGRKLSPTGRKLSPPGRKFSPPDRKFSPPGRKFSPTSRRISPSNRRDESHRMSPSDSRRMGGHRSSPKRLSPNRRLVSPQRSNRYLDSHHEKLGDKFMSADNTLMKPIRPAYDAVQAQNQAFSSGYRGDVHDNIHYSGRQPEPRGAPWQNDKTFPQNMKKEELRNEIIRRSETTDKSHGRLSRSPIRRERSPLKDRYRRPSPSRSPLSPRRSWALEKRSSPDAVREPPPPPIWPGQETEDKSKRNIIHFEIDSSKRAPVWERSDRRPDDDRKSYENKLRIRSDFADKFSQQPTHRREFEERRDFRSETDRKPFEDRRDFRLESDRKQFEDKNDCKPEADRKQFEDRRDLRPAPDRKQFELDRSYHRKEDRLESSRRREDSPRREEKSVLTEIDRDFQDIYKRAVEFRKKTEELQKSNDRRRNDFDVARREDDKKYRQQHLPRRSRESSPERHDDQSKSGEWKIQDRKRLHLSPSVKAKREKAVIEIANKILNKYDVKSDLRLRVFEQLKLTLSNTFLEMFDDKDVSFIELVIKYQARYDEKAEEIFMQDLLSKLPSQYRNLKRKNEDAPDISAKTSRFSSLEDKPERKYVSSSRRRIDKVRQNIRRAKDETFAAARKEMCSSSAEKTALDEPYDIPEQTSDYYELSPLMSKALESELNDVMEQVNKVLSNDMTDEAEKMVWEKFNKKAGDSLRDAFGLTVTKLLLPVNDATYVKMLFHGKPSRDDLIAFLKKYEVRSFKRMGKSFLAKVKNFQSLNALCTPKKIKCTDNVYVSVIPKYQFTYCPQSLKTRYNRKYKTNEYDQNDKFQEQSQKTDVKEKTKKNTIKEMQTKTTESAVNKNASQRAESKDIVRQAAKKVTQIAVKNTDEKVNKPIAENKKNVPAKVVPTKQNQTTVQNATKPTSSKPNEKASVKKEIPKVIANTAEPVTRKAPGKVIEQCTKPAAKTNEPSAKPAAKTNEPSATPIAKTDELSAKPAAKTNEPSAKPAAKTNEPSAKPAFKTNQPSANPAAKLAKITSTKSAATNGKSVNPKSIQKVPSANQSASARTPVKSNKPVTFNKVSATKKTENDFDELDDRDILALLSEGIVVDECSGSGEDN